jgi:hypothetical protein
MWIYMHRQDSNRKSEDSWRVMGDTLTFVNRINLVAIAPHNDLASTRYCLADPGREYLIYLPLDHPHWTESWIASARFFWRFKPLVSELSMWFRRTVTVNLSHASGELAVEWFNPRTAQVIAAGKTTGKTGRSFKVPFRGEAVLYISSRKVASQQ